MRAFPFSPPRQLSTNQEEISPDSGSAGPLILDFQYPELWEINVCRLSSQLIVFCYIHQS